MPRALKVGDELLTGTKKSKQWVEEVLQEPLRADDSDSDDMDGLDVFSGIGTDLGRSLALWCASRSRLEPLRGVWEEAEACDSRTPGWDRCVALVSQYETAKRLYGRVDFVDILARFAGYRFSVDGADQRAPEGDVPGLDAWIHDEMQDSSKLLDACFRRLIDTPQCRWVFIAADPFQSVYRFSGADFHCFFNYPTAKQEIMPKSWRCASEILALGERLISETRGYINRHVAPAYEGGEIDEWFYADDWESELKPSDSWLILARTNYQAARMARRLDAASGPLGANQEGDGLLLEGAPCGMDRSKRCWPWNRARRSTAPSGGRSWACCPVSEKSRNCWCEAPRPTWAG